MSYRQSPLRPRYGRRRGPAPGVIVVIVVVLLAAGAAAYRFYPRGKHHHLSPPAGVAASSEAAAASASALAAQSPSDALVQAFVAAWSSGNLATIAYANGLTGTAVQTQYAATVATLQARSVKVTAGPVTPTDNDDVSNAALAVTWQLPGNQVWSYPSTVEVDNTDGSWQVDWQPAVIQPTLNTGDSLRYTRIEPKRATILDGAGQPIITDREVQDIGVEAGKAGNPTTTANQLATILGINGPSMAARIKAAPSDEFVEAITLRQADYEQVALQLQTVPGIVLRDEMLPLSPSHNFARSLLGTVGPVTAQIISESNGRYVDGDMTGIGGLEQDFDSTLAGTPGYEIDVLHAPSQIGAPIPTVLKVQPAVNGTSLQTTLDETVEAAADAAIAPITQPVALVAVRISTGQVIAVANGPDGGGFDTGLLGAVPPGSAFKIVTTTALLEKGFNVNAPVVCSPQIVVDGKTFHNYEGEEFGSVPFHTDFAKSCNTAFISLAPQLPGPTLFNTAQALGIGACWSLGTPAFRGSVTPPKDAVDLAATSFGQGSTLVSPVSLAVAVATVARGHYVPPQLVVNGRTQSCGSPPSSSSSASPAGSSPTAPASGSAPAAISASPVSPAAASSAAPPVPQTPGPPLPAGVITQLHALMREVVTKGTAMVLLNAPGQPVMAKTGTAEYGSGATPKTHAWLVGYQGDIAFAVYVQDGQSGGTVAAPVALQFLQDLAPSLPSATETAARK